MKRKLPAIFYNGTTLFGMTVAVVMLILTLIMIALELFGGITSAYGGLITYIALPGAMLFGLFIAAIGLWRARRRQKRGLMPGELPIVDFNQPRHRFLATSFLLGGLVLTALSGFGSFKGYEYTESVEFCGTTCHIVMEPEHTTYQASPHAQVSCAGCHIGSGVDWYVKSKLSGSYQVYSTLLNKFERPIKTPIDNLRPAKDTCEKCHSPKHFFAQKLRTYSYFLSDETNTPHTMDMLVKIGGGEGSEAEGIHAHMFLDSEISYVASDRQRQEIPYVEMKDKNGKVTIFRDTEAKFTDADIKKGERRVVDCIDCHNRPTHIFKSADRAINTALSTGVMDRSIPEIKMKGVELLDAPYATVNEATTKIADGIRAYYKENYADYYAANTPKIEGAIKALHGIYRGNYFPAMKTDWRSHNDNIDHMRGNGCFRCHNNKLKSDTGRVIKNDCKSCHKIVSQGKPGAAKTDYSGLEFQHPVDVGDAWKTTPCRDCHGPQKE